MKTILLVDDNKYLLDGLSMSLSLYLKTYTILTAKNGEQAVEIIKSVRPDFILSDLQMPVMDGFALIEYVRKNHPTTPMFVMTGNYTREVEERLRSLNVVQCLKKPFDFRKLATTISTILEQGARSRMKGHATQASMAEPGLFALSLEPNG